MQEQQAEPQGSEAALWPPFPWFQPVSGRYEARFPIIRPIPLPFPRPIPLPIPRDPQPGPFPGPLPGPGPDPAPGGFDGGVLDGVESLDPAEGMLDVLPFPWFRRHVLRLDVDGRWPQMTASGQITVGITKRAHWIARLKRTAWSRWAGTIWYKDGDTALVPHTQVTIDVVRSWLPSARRATVTFSGGAPACKVAFRWKSAFYDEVDFEFDTVKGTNRVKSIKTCDHPNRPSSLPCEELSVEEVFRRSGFQVTSREGNVPLAAAHANERWSNMEMHDAMQDYWSRFADAPQWALWVLNAGLHETGTSLGGIMFDDIGPNHRQGTAIFNDAFISNAPAGDPAPAAWVARMKFWTNVHEMGHAFNLAHSWQKALGTQWIPLANEPEARSFMNYPYNVTGGEAAFFADFEYRFSDGELLFLRHAPRRFVEMGNADWFDDHGFEDALVSPRPAFRLELRHQRRAQAAFEFMEPVVLELKLENVSGEPRIVEETVLHPGPDLTVIIKRKGLPARRWAPYATYCMRSSKVVVDGGEARYGQIDVSAGLNGWDIADPGTYQVQVALRLGDEDVVSNPLIVRVRRPESFEQDRLAQDYFSEEVGRTLFFGGTMAKEQGNVLREARNVGGPRVAAHARWTLANPLARDYKRLNFDEKKREISGIGLTPAKPTEAVKELEAVLDGSPEALDTFGHIGYRARVERLGDLLAEQKGDSTAARGCLKDLRAQLAARDVPERILDTLDAGGGAHPATARGKGRRTAKAGR